MRTPERWEALGRRIGIHSRQQPDMATAQGPRRWAQILLMWALEAMFLAYGRDASRAKIREAVTDFFSAKSGEL